MYQKVLTTTWSRDPMPTANNHVLFGHASVRVHLALLALWHLAFVTSLLSSPLLSLISSLFFFFFFACLCCSVSSSFSFSYFYNSAPRNRSRSRSARRIFYLRLTRIPCLFGAKHHLLAQSAKTVPARQIFEIKVPLNR